MKRVIINGMTGSSWFFKRFEQISMISMGEENVLAY